MADGRKDGERQETPGSGPVPYLAALHQLLLRGRVLVGGGGVLRGGDGLGGGGGGLLGCVLAEGGTG